MPAKNVDLTPCDNIIADVTFIFTVCSCHTSRFIDMLCINIKKRLITSLLNYFFRLVIVL